MTRIFAAVLLSLAFIVPVFAGDEKDEATYRKIESQLESTTIDTLAYEEADCAEVIKDIAKKARVTIAIDKTALEGVAEDDRKITLELADIKAMNALNIVIDQIGLFKQYKNGILYITTEEKAAEATITKTYDVRDITVKINDFAAPKLRLKGEDTDDRVIIDYGDDEKDVATDDIVEMIEDSVEADWGGTATISISQGQLIIRAPRNVQKDVAELIDQLRASK